MWKCDYNMSDAYLHHMELDVWKDQVFFNQKWYPAGTFVTELLNVPSEQIDQIMPRCGAFAKAATAWGEKGGWNAQQELKEMEATFRGYIDALWCCPPFCYMSRGKEIEGFHRFFFEHGVKAGTEEYEFVVGCLLRVFGIPYHIFNFYRIAENLERNFYARLRRRSEAALTLATAQCFENGDFQKMLEALPGVEHYPISLSPKFELCYNFATFPDKANSIIFLQHPAFEQLFDFYVFDLLNGIHNGHAPSKCQNCGRYYLTTSAHASKYCDGIAPQDANYTCRQYGAMKNQKDKNANHPVYRTFNTRTGTIRTHHRRGKISYAVRVMALDLAAEYRDKALLDSAYAADGYACDMEQETLYAEVRRRLEE